MPSDIAVGGSVMVGYSSLNHVYRTVWNEALGAMVAVAEQATGHVGSVRSQAYGCTLSALNASREALRPLAVAFAVAVLCYGAALPVWANPQGGVAIHGQATFQTPQPNTLLVTTQNGAGTNHSAINWQSFSIPTGSTTQIVQPNATSMSINRVVTKTPSTLFGTLRSNGQVVLVNQAGIAVGSGALVDTAGFTASAVGMTAVDAAAGRLRFAGDGLASTSGALTVQGNIIARGGDVVLIAPSVELAQSAVVQAQGGSVVLAAGQSVEVTGRGLEGITLQVQAPTDQALNLGSLKGDAVGIFAGTLRHSGLIQATQASMEGGKVVLKAAADAYVQGDGRIEATSAMAQGGRIEVLGSRVAVMDNAVLDASGVTGGGTVLVGGDYQGQNAAVPNAQVTYFGADAVLRANATEQGNGGKVVVWADDTTRAYGRIEARGGAWGGNGGFIENSGKRYLDFRGVTDTAAPRGFAGTLLLDPNDIHIDNSTDDFQGGMISGGLFAGGTGNPTITWTTINAQTGSLEIQTNSAASSGAGDIYLDASGTLTGPSALTLLANRAINFGSGVVLNAGSADVNLVAGWANIGFSVSSGAGKDIIFSNNSALQTSGDVWMNAGNSVYSVDTTAVVAANKLTIGNTNGFSLPGGVDLKGVNMVDTLAVQSDGGGILNFKNGKSLTIGAGAFGINGIDASGNTQSINIKTTVGDLTVANAIVSDVLGGAPITLEAAGALNINSALLSTYNASPSGPIKLVAGSGGISSTVAGVITTNELEIISGGAVSLNAPNVVTTLAANVTGSGLGFTNSNGFSVGMAGLTSGITVANGDVTLESAGLNKLLTISNPVQATNGNVSYVADNQTHAAATTSSATAGKYVEVKPYTASTAIELSSAPDAAGVLRLSSTELDLFTTPLFKLGNSAVTGGVAVTQAVNPANFTTMSLITGGTGNISQSASSALTIANLNADAAGTGSVTLNEANVLSGNLAGRAGVGGFQFTNAGALNIGQVDVVNNGINTSGGGNITLTAGGAITENAGAMLSTTGTLLTTSVGGTVLSNNNSVRNVIADNTVSGNFTFYNSGSALDVSVNNGSGTGAVLIKNSGDIGLLSTGVTTFAVGNAATLVAGGNFLNPNNYGITLLGTGSRWLIYSANSSSNNSGALLMGSANFQQYGATYPSTTVLGTGNGFLYSTSVSPVAVPVSLAGSVSKVFDGNTNAPLTSSNYVLGGVTDTMFGTSSGASLSGLGSGAYASPNVGTGIGVSTSGGTATVTFSSGMVYGYSLGAASAAIGEITPAPIVITPVSASLVGTADKVYDGTLLATLAPGNFLLSGFVGSDAATVTKTTGTYVSKDVGNAIGVSTTLATPDFMPMGNTQLTNYSLPTSAQGNIGVITPKNLTVAPTVSSKVYDGTLLATLAPGNFLLSGFVDSDAATVTKTTGTYVSKDVGNAIGVSTTLATTDFMPMGNTQLTNYSLPTSAQGNIGVITPKNLTVAPTVSSKVYDGTVTANVTDYGLTGFVPGELVTAISTSAAFDTKDVGAAKRVTVSGISLVNDTGLASNYSVPISADAFADITAVPVVAPVVVEPLALDGATDYLAMFFEKFQIAAQNNEPSNLMANRESAGEAGSGSGSLDDKKRDKLRAKDNIVLEGETCKP